MVLVSLTFWSFIIILSKYVSKDDSPITMVSYQYTLMTLFALPLAIYFWEMPSLISILYVFIGAISGTILQVPVKEGDQAIEANTFNPGTTIATVADLNKMIFEGRVDEGEVSKLKTGLPLKIEIGAIEDKVYDAKLTLIAPKGIEVAGAIQFQIEGEVYLDDEYIIRAGYSANATIVTQTKENVLLSMIKLKSGIRQSPLSEEMLKMLMMNIN